MGKLVLEGISKRFGAVEVLKTVDLDVADGEFIVIVGPSGCGKSTLLRIIAGLSDQSTGKVLIGGQDVSSLPPSKRGIAMVFQSYALYPHLTVEGNLTLGLKQARTAASLIAERVAEAVRILALEPFLKRRPGELSGGQRQRVAIGRAIVRHPEVFLFDEPLSNLDAALRNQVRAEIADLHRRLGATMVYVTHDQVEAMTLAGSGRLPCTAAANGAVTAGIRPNGFEVLPAGSDGLAGTLIGSEYLGAESFLRVRLTDGTVVTVHEHPDHGWLIDQPVTLRLRPGNLHLFDAESGLRIAEGPDAAPQPVAARVA